MFSVLGPCYACIVGVLLACVCVPVQPVGLV